MANIRRLDNTSTYKIETERFVYAVNLTRLTNGQCGQPRYEAQIIVLLAKEDGESIDRKDNFYTAHYRFGGHYCGDRGEAEYIVKRFEEEGAN